MNKVQEDILTYLVSLPKFTPTFVSEVSRGCGHDKNTTSRNLDQLRYKKRLDGVVACYEKGGLKLYVRVGGDVDE